MIRITIILPVYCNIIAALVQVTSLIFFTNNFDEMIHKKSLTRHDLYENYCDND